MNNYGEASSSYFEQQQQQQSNFSPTHLLKLAETHLRVHNFSLCHQYALQAQQPNDLNYAINNLYASQLLAISNVLSNPTDYYSILQVTPLCNDLALIKSQFMHVLSLIDPIKEKFDLGNEALDLVLKAYGCLSDPTKKAQFDSEYDGQGSENGSESEGFDVGTFWTFCPYCFYMYEYPRVYEGCCLRCQNQACRRGFHGVVVNSLPKMEFDKGVYFNCYGYFPLGFSPEIGGKKFESWSPIVGMFPVSTIGKNPSKMDLNDDGHDWFNNDDFVDPMVESEDESGDDNQGVKGVGDVEGVNVGNAGTHKRKSRKLMSRGGKSNDGVGVNGSRAYGEEDGYEGEDAFEVGNGGVGDGSPLESDSMAFYEENGEIFVGLGPDDAF